ncbi:unnamed protein product, partial [Mesorhabditis belari]|uniref:C-type lectin domain-containing protein n=1 Tax=Mesorhabditis belari TaxID=2138241 RepID=A0AAF3F067_9BILA
MLKLFLLNFVFVTVLCVHGEGCQNGAIDFSDQNECIQAFGSAVSQNSARQSCIHLDFFQGQLVQPKNAYENQQAALLVNPSLLYSNLTYIGVEKLEVNGEWSYVDGTELVYKNWATNEPSENPAKSCAAIGVTGDWWTVDCDRELPFICTYPDNK